MRRAPRFAGIALMLLVALSVSAVPSRAEAAADAAISGIVVNGTKDKATVPGLEVTLHVFQGDAEASTRKTSTGDDGSFSFGGLEGGGTWGYALTTRHQDADYHSVKFGLGPSDTRNVELSVYDASSSPADLKLDRWIIWVDREGSGVALQYDVDVANTGTTTFTGDDTLPDGKKAVMRLPVPRGVGNYQYLGAFMRCCPVPGEGTFTHTAAIAPGNTQGTVRMSARSLKKLSLKTPLPVGELTLLVPTDVKVNASGFTANGQSEDRGVTYRVFSASQLPAGREFGVTLTGIASGGLARTSGWILVGAGVAGLGAVGGRSALRRRRGGVVPAAPRRSTGATNGAARTAPAKTIPSGEASSDEIDLLVEEIATLDLAFERGLMTEDTYQRLRRARKAQLVHGAGRPGGDTS